MDSKLMIFFDGACHLCSREMEHYKIKKHEGRLEFVDISDPLFAAEKFGLDRKQVQKFMHAKDESGRIFTGVDAFIQIWKRLPSFGLAVRLAENGFIRPIMDVGYHAFAKIRPYLPQRSRRLCDDGSCNTD